MPLKILKIEWFEDGYKQQLRPYHQFDFVVELWMGDHSHPEHNAAHGMADVNEFLASCRAEHIIEYGREVVAAHLVPSVATNTGSPVISSSFHQWK